MKNYHSLFGLLLASCVKFNINQVSATNIPTTFPELSSAGSVNVSDLHSLLANITSPREIDPAFGFVPVFGADKLRAVPCLLSTVNFVLQLGLGDYKGSIPETTFLLDSHPQVEIKVVPDVDRGRIRRKYALWGLSIGIGIYLFPNSLISFRRGLRKAHECSASSTNCSSPKRKQEIIYDLGRAILTLRADM